jgi:hypothetical protein
MLCPSLFDLIILIRFGEKFKWQSSSLCNFFRSPVTPLTENKIFSSAPCSQRPLPVSILLLMWETKIHSHTKQQAKVHVREVREDSPLIQRTIFWTRLLRLGSIFGAVSEALPQMKIRRRIALRTYMDMFSDWRTKSSQSAVFSPAVAW